MAPKREQTALPTQREVKSTNDFAFWGLDFQEVPFVNLEKKTCSNESIGMSYQTRGQEVESSLTRMKARDRGAASGEAGIPHPGPRLTADSWRGEGLILKCVCLPAECCGKQTSPHSKFTPE